MQSEAARQRTFFINSTGRCWPHSVTGWSATPMTLAKAGFYFTPIVDEEQSDCVRCFLCSKTLDGWTPEDKPAEEHCKHNNACPWVIACIEAAGGASSGAAVGDVSTTTEKQREAARVATFGTAKDAWWPHARVTKLSAKSMSRAGFTYNPAEDSADMVQCFHCGLALDGWEPHDDPLVEHLKRSPECDGIAASVRKKAKGKGKAAVAEDVATSRRSSTVSTVSTTSSRRAGRSRRKADGDVTMDDGASVVDSDASFMSVASSVGEASFVSAASDFSVISTTSQAAPARRGRRKAKTETETDDAVAIVEEPTRKIPARRGRKKAVVEETQPDVEEEMLPEELVQGKAGDDAVLEDMGKTNNDDGDDDDQSSAPSTQLSAQQTLTQTSEEVAEEEEAPAPATRAGRAVRSKKAPVVAVAKPARAVRGKRKVEVDETSAVVVQDQQSDEVEQKEAMSRPARSTRATRAKTMAEELPKKAVAAKRSTRKVALKKEATDEVNEVVANVIPAIPEEPHDGITEEFAEAVAATPRETVEQDVERVPMASKDVDVDNSKDVDMVDLKDVDMVNEEESAAVELPKENIENIEPAVAAADAANDMVSAKSFVVVAEVDTPAPMATELVDATPFSTDPTIPSADLDLTVDALLRKMQEREIQELLRSNDADVQAFMEYVNEGLESFKKRVRIV